MPKMPKIGQRNNTKTRYHSSNGLKTFLISNVGDIEVLLMNHRTYQGEIAHNLSGKKRAAIIERARELSVHLTNKNAKVRATPAE